MRDGNAITNFLESIGSARWFSIVFAWDEHFVRLWVASPSEGRGKGEGDYGNHA